MSYSYSRIGRTNDELYSTADANWAAQDIDPVLNWTWMNCKEPAARNPLAKSNPILAAIYSGNNNVSGGAVEKRD